jgi:hypothetical protein
MPFGRERSYAGSGGTQVQFGCAGVAWDSLAPDFYL